MLSTLEITHSPTQMAAVIRFTIPQKELPSVMGPAIDELFATLKAQGIEPAGPLFNHYLSMDSGLFDFEVGVPVKTLVKPMDRVRPGGLPAARVARVIYTGPYDQLHKVWREFGKMVRDEGLEPVKGLWESYLEGPETSSDSTKWRTELNQPIMDTKEKIVTMSNRFACGD